MDQKTNLRIVVPYNDIVTALVFTVNVRRHWCPSTRMVARKGAVHWMESVGEATPNRPSARMDTATSHHIAQERFGVYDAEQECTTEGNNVEASKATQLQP